MHRHRSLFLAITLLAAAGAAAALPAEGPLPPPAPPPAPGPGLVTLYSGDPLTHTLNLVDGSFGAHIEGAFLSETRAHLDYGNYNDDSLTIALDDDDRGFIVDLGHWADIAHALEIEEADGGGVTFASISVDGANVRVAKRFPKDSFQNLVEARPILSSLAGEKRANLPPVAGHIYLVRIKDRHDKAPVVYAKILVVSHRPGESVVLRWEPIPGV